jgi:hypothetical protein
MVLSKTMSIILKVNYVIVNAYEMTITDVQ